VFRGFRRHLHLQFRAALPSTRRAEIALFLVDAQVLTLQRFASFVDSRQSQLLQGTCIISSLDDSPSPPLLSYDDSDIWAPQRNPFLASRLLNEMSSSLWTVSCGYNLTLQQQIQSTLGYLKLSEIARLLRVEEEDLRLWLENSPIRQPSAFQFQVHSRFKKVQSMRKGFDRSASPAENSTRQLRLRLRKLCSMDFLSVSTIAVYTSLPRDAVVRFLESSDGALQRASDREEVHKISSWANKLFQNFPKFGTAGSGEFSGCL